MSKLEADIMLLEFITAGMVVPVQNPAVMGCFEPAVKCYSDVVTQPGMLITMEDGLLGFADVKDDYATLHLWATKVNPNGSTE